MKTLAFVFLLGAAVPASAGDPPATVGVPGGAPSREPRDCSAAHDHCMRGEAWFASGFMDENGTAAMRPVFEQGGKWYPWSGRLVDGGTAYRTKVATADTLVDGRQAIVFSAKLPRTELEALTSKGWIVVAVWKIDGAAGTFDTDRGTYRIDAARILFDPRSI
jgi:hypothetical protein